MNVGVDPTGRFTRCVEDYDRWRPGYPASVLDVLRTKLGFDSRWVVADVGSGTGLASELLLDHGNPVFAVEPNDAMRSAAERRLGGRQGFESVRGTAERTGLGAGSVDLVLCAQAFHWFDPVAARVEFERILREPKRVALVWNTLHKDSTPFMRAYEALLREHCADYLRVRQEDRRDSVDGLFVNGFERSCVPNEQLFDLEGLQGRLLSLSYTPPPDHPSFSPMIADLRELFREHQEDGSVRMTYDCEVLTGVLGPVT